MTEEELKNLEELCAKATPGPWRAHNAEYETVVLADVLADHYENGIGTFYGTKDGLYDAELTTAARDALPKLIAKVRELRDVIGQMENDYACVREQLEVHQILNPNCRKVK